MPATISASTATPAAATTGGEGATPSLSSRLQDIQVLATGRTTRRYSWNTCSTAPPYVMYCSYLLRAGRGGGGVAW